MHLRVLSAFLAARIYQLREEVLIDLPQSPGQGLLLFSTNEDILVFHLIMTVLIYYVQHISSAFITLYFLEKGDRVTVLCAIYTYLYQKQQ